MTLASDGSGAFAYRVTIDGCPSSPVTHTSMVAAASAGAPARVDGLNLSKQEFKAEANPLACTLSVGGLVIKCADIDGAWSAVFDKAPSHTTWLIGDCTAAATSIEVASTTGFASAGYIWVDSECIAYTSVDATHFLGCTRGSLSDDSDAATYHYTDDGARQRSPEVTDWPVLWENRRVRVYRYQETDLASGNGTQVYLGMIDTAPKFDGVMWSVGVRSIASILSQTLGSDLSDASYVRGVLYPPETPCTIRVRELAGTTIDSAGSASCVAEVTGFFESQESFVNDSVLGANVKLIAAMATGSVTNNSLRMVSDGPSGFHFEYTTLAGGSARMIMMGRSGGREAAGLSLIDSAFGGPSGGPQTAEGREVASVTASTKYYFWPHPGALEDGTPSERTGIPGAGTVPRGMTNVFNEEPILYLGGASSISSLVNSILIEWQPTIEGSEAITDTYQLDAYDVGDRSITLLALDFALGVSPTTRRAWTSASLPEVRFGLGLSEFGGLPLGSLGLMRTITSNQQQFSTLGVVPMLREGDWDESGWNDIIRGQPQFVTRRWYSTFSPISLGDMVTEELKLSRAFLAVDASGRLVPKRIRLPAASELSTAATIDQETLLTDEVLLSHEVSGLGQVNEVVIRTEYDPTEDKFLGRAIKVRDVAAYGQSPSVRSVAIAPKSQYMGPPITDDEAVELAAGIFGTFAGNYATDTLDVAMHDGVELGDAIVFDNPHYPDGSGAIGVTGKVGLVIGRKTGTYSPRATLTVLTTRQKLGGYAPAADVDSAIDNGGNSWTISLDGALYPSGTTSESWWANGDRVRVVEANASSATVVAGTVADNSLGANAIEVQFDGAWAGPASGTAFWYLTMADSDDASLAETQRRFCSIANEDGVIDYASNDQPAFRFGA